MPKDHLWRVTRFQRHAIHVLDLSKAVRDDGMPQRVLFPPDTGRFRHAPSFLVKYGFGVLPYQSVRRFT